MIQEALSDWSIFDTQTGLQVSIGHQSSAGPREVSEPDCFLCTSKYRGSNAQQKIIAWLWLRPGVSYILCPVFLDPVCCS